MNPKLEPLLQLPNTWQASRGPRLQAGLATGYEALDKTLHQGGWPRAATTELLLEQPGIGELRLLLPTLARRQQKAHWMVLIDPPWQPFAPGLQQAGIDLQRLLIIRPGNLKELLWCADQCLASGNCSAVLTWSIGKPLLDRDLRRLQQSATSGNCWHVLLRHQREQHNTSPSALRIALQPAADSHLQLHILKQRGGWSGQTVTLLPHDQPRPQPREQPVYLGPLPEAVLLGHEQNTSPTRSSKVTSLTERAANLPSALA